MTTEGNPEHFFAEDTLEDQSDEQERESEVEVPTLEGLEGGLESEIVRLRAEGYEVDDDNEPAPENTPAQAASSVHAAYTEWGASGVCQRRAENLRQDAARLLNVTTETVISGLDILAMFIKCFYPGSSSSMLFW